MPNPFLLSIEPVDGVAYRHPFHLGTIESVARHEAEETFHGRNRHGFATRTVALMRDGRLFDVYDGAGWSSDQPVEDEPWDTDCGLVEDEGQESERRNDAWATRRGYTD